MIEKQKLRVIISTDIGGNDPDDFQSMVHYLVCCAHKFDTEGLISSPPYAGRTKDLHACIDAYAADYPNLVSWSEEYPRPEALREVIRQGVIDIQEGEEPNRDISEGAQLIIDRAKIDDPRPLYVLGWGSFTDIAQAIHKAPEIKSRLRIVYIGSWNTVQCPKSREYAFKNHPDLWWIENDTTFRGMYMGGSHEGDLGNKSFPAQHVAGHGALGDFFMSKMTQIKMGDTPTVLYLMSGNPENPGNEHWGGAFVQPFPKERPNYWHDNQDPSLCEGDKFGAKTVSKWRESYLRDWQKGMERARKAKN